MKRYRILLFDFDTRVYILTQEIRDEWEDNVKKQHRENKEAVGQSLIGSYGSQAQEAKRQNFIDLCDKPLSILAFHNRFFEQIRTAFVMGAYKAGRP
jgi:oligoendopeptidase F